MPRYHLAYFGGTPPASQDAAAAMLARFTDWLAELGPALLEPQAPLTETWTITAGAAEADGGTRTMMGYSVLEAADTEAAVALAQGCPFLEMDGARVELSRIIEM